MTSIQFEPINPDLGAYARVAAEDILEEDNPARILEALNSHGVLVFPQVGISDEQQVALSAQLGEMEAAVATADGSAPSSQGIYRIALDKEDRNHLDYVAGNDYWHMDGTSYRVPGKGTLLKCESPPHHGGETDFANLYAAYEALPEEKKRALEGLRVIHCLEAVTRRFYAEPTEEDLARWHANFPPTEHPLIWRQKNGKTSLVIGATAAGIVGMSEEEGKILLEELLDWCTQERFTYRHHWQRGDLVIFNNPGLLHRSRPYDIQAGRVMHRTTLKGYEAVA